MEVKTTELFFQKLIFNEDIKFLWFSKINQKIHTDVSYLIVF